MELEFDPIKDSANIAKHGVSLARTTDFKFQNVVVDNRFDYGEVRYRAFGRLNGSPHVLAFTVVEGRIRAISLRRAHQKEHRRYVQEP
jgi:uncharacterized DUF497 family protein